jgi:hypothetical protein
LDLRADFGNRLARLRNGRQDDADGEHGNADREGRPQHRLAPVPGPLRLPRMSRCSPGMPGCRAPCPGRSVPAAQSLPAPGRIGQEARDRQPDRGHRERFGRGMGRTGPDLFPDSLQAVRTRLHLVRGRVQLTPHELGKLLPVRAIGAAAESHHDSCSSSARSAAMPRAV